MPPDNPMRPGPALDEAGKFDLGPHLTFPLRAATDHEQHPARQGSAGSTSATNARCPNRSGTTKRSGPLDPRKGRRPLPGDLASPTNISDSDSRDGNLGPGSRTDDLRVGPAAKQFVDADECIFPPPELVGQLSDVQMDLVLSFATQVQQ